METLKVHKKNGVGWITFHRPEVRNAVNSRMMEELEEQLNRWQEDDGVKVLVLAGDSGTFVSGGDLVEFHRLTRREEVYPVMHRMGRLLDRVACFGKPTVAAIEGTAVGGGCEIAASCDFRVASDRAVFAFVQARLGITSGWGGGGRLLRQLPRSEALYWLLTGERFGAEDAFRSGWVHRVFSAEGFTESVQLYAEKLASAPLPVIKAYIRLADAVRNGTEPEELLEMESRSCAELWETEEHFRAVEAFLNKKKDG